MMIFYSVPENFDIFLCEDDNLCEAILQRFNIPEKWYVNRRYYGNIGGYTMHPPTENGFVWSYPRPRKGMYYLKSE